MNVDRSLFEGRERMENLSCDLRIDRCRKKKITKDGLRQIYSGFEEFFPFFYFQVEGFVVFRSFKSF